MAPPVTDASALTDLTRDYTREIREATSFPQALELGLGKGRLAPGETLSARSVAEVCITLAAASRFGGHVRLGPAQGPDEVGLRLDALVGITDVDPTSGLVRAEAGVTVSSLEARLADAGLTLGAALLATPEARIGAAIAAGAWPGAAMRLEAVLPDGTPLCTPLAPRRATGPDPDALLHGLNDRLAVLVAAVLRLDPRAQQSRVEHVKGPPSALLEAMRVLLRDHRLDVELSATSDGQELTVEVSGDDARFDTGLALLASLRAVGAVSVTGGLPAPPLGRTEVAGWRRLQSRVAAGGPVWLHRIGRHGAWLRPGPQGAIDDPWLAQARAALDPGAVLRHDDAPLRRRKGRAT